MKKHERKQKEKEALRTLKIKIGVITERVELLEHLDQEMKGTGGVTALPLGPLVDDLATLNPFTQQAVVPFLLDLYRIEEQEHKALLVKQS
jgi:hypothetical protein